MEAVQDENRLHTTHSDSRTFPTSQPYDQVEMDNFPAPVAGELSASITRPDMPPCFDGRGQSTSLISDARPSESSSEGNSSRQQSSQTTQPRLLTDPNILYSSKAFKILIFLYVSTVAIPFLTMLTFSWNGGVSGATFLLYPAYLGMIIVPTILGTHVLWFAFILPWSGATER